MISCKMKSTAFVLVLAALLLPACAFAAFTPACDEHPSADVYYELRTGMVLKDTYAHHVYQFNEPHCAECGKYIGEGFDIVDNFCTLCDRVIDKGFYEYELSKPKYNGHRELYFGSLEAPHIFGDEGVCLGCGFYEYGSEKPSTFDFTVYGESKKKKVTYNVKVTMKNNVQISDSPTRLFNVMQDRARDLDNKAVGGLARVLEKTRLYVNHPDLMTESGDAYTYSYVSEDNVRNIPEIAVGITYRNRTYTIVDVWASIDNDYWYQVRYNGRLLWISAGVVEVKLNAGDKEILQYELYRKRLNEMEAEDEPKRFYVTKAGRVRSIPNASQNDPRYQGYTNTILGHVQPYQVYDILDEAKDINGATWYKIKFEVKYQDKSGKWIDEYVDGWIAKTLGQAK